MHTFRPPRRHLLLGATALIAILGGCATLTVPQAVTDAQSIPAAFAAALPSLATLVSAATLASLQTGVAAVSAAAAAFASNFSTAPATAGEALADAVNAVLQIVTTQPVAALIPQPIELVFAAGAALLPSILAAAGLTAAAAAAVPAMPAAAARLILQAAIKG